MTKQDLLKIRDAEAEKYADKFFVRNEYLEEEEENARSGIVNDFKTGFDARDKLGNEALKIAVDALEKIGHDTTVNCQADDAEKECFDVAQVALAEIRKLRGEG